MNRLLSCLVAKSTLFWLAAILLHSASPAQVRAYPIEYSWTGQISPLYSQNDPWGLGPSGEPFHLSFTLASDEQGYACDSLFVSACFPMTSSKLVVNGKSIPMTTNGTVKFVERYDLAPGENRTPGSAPPRNLIIFTAGYQDIGRPTQLISIPALAPDAFHITDFNGPPIKFGSLQTVGDFVGAIDIYQMVVPAGVTVSIIPEPSTLLLLGIGAISLLGYRKAKSR
jgi:PEP-CTERM motif